MVERGPKPRQRQRYHLPSLLLGATVGVAVGLLVKERLTDFLFPASNPLNPNIEPSKAVSNSPETAQLTKQLLNDWLRIKSTYETILVQQLTLDEQRVGSLSTAPEINRFAKQHLIDGLYLAKLFSPIEETVTIRIEQSQSKVILHNREFNLNDPLNFHILASLLELTLKNQSLKLEEQTLQEKLTQGEVEEKIGNRFQLEQEKNQRAIDNLLWLLDENPPTHIEKEAFALLPTEHLTNLSLVLQSLKRSNLPFPKKVSYIKYFKGAPGGAWYKDHNQPEPFTIEITNNSGTISIVHEIGHFLSDSTYLDPNNQRLQEISQSEYERQIKASLEKHSQNIKDLRHTIPVEASPPELLDNPIEDYAATFQTFFWQGPEFRMLWLESIQRLDPAAYEVLRIKYNFMKRLFGGLEFKAAGEIWTKKYKTGDVVLIKDEDEDEDKDKPGILLRQDPNKDDLHPLLPAVWDGDWVRISEGPMIKIDRRDPDLYKERTFWRIQILARGFESAPLLGWYLSEADEGWISEKWLGETRQ